MPRLCGQKGKLLGLLNALSHTRTHPPPAILYSLYMYLQATHVVSLPTSYIYIYIYKTARDDEHGMGGSGMMARGASALGDGARRGGSGREKPS